MPTSIDPIPGPDPGACPECGQWRKAGMVHECPSDTAASTYAETVRAGILAGEDVDPDGSMMTDALDALSAMESELQRLRDALERTGSLFSPLEHFQWQQIKALEKEVAELRVSGCARPLSAERDGAVNAKDNPPATGEGAL